MITSPKMATPPSVPTDLIGGHFRSFRKDPTGFLTRLSALGDISYFRMGPQHAYFINRPEYIRDVLVTNEDMFIKGRALQRAKSLLGDGLLTSEGDVHFRQRRMIQPAFHKARIAEYARSIVEYGSRTAASWQDRDVRDIDREMMRLTLQIVAKTLFNANVEDDADEIGAAMTSIVKLFNFLLLPFAQWLEKLPLPHSRRYRTARDKLNSVIYGIINERRRSGEDKGDLLSMLLDARDENDGSAMTDEQIRDEALTLFLAGHETTANAMTWTWYLLSINPEAEARVHEELGRVLRGRTPTFEDLPHLTYTEAVVAESMRLFPPAWAIGRLTLEEYSIGGYTIQPGSLLLASPYVMQRDPLFWDEPESLRPERWSRLSVKEAGQRFVYFPFGGGTRRCIGESFAWTETILLLATIAQKWQLRLLPEQKIGLQPMITLRPKFGMQMLIEKR